MRTGPPSATNNFSTVSDCWVWSPMIFALQKRVKFQSLLPGVKNEEIKGRDSGDDFRRELARGDRGEREEAHVYLGIWCMNKVQSKKT